MNKLTNKKINGTIGDLLQEKRPFRMKVQFAAATKEVKKKNQFYINFLVLDLSENSGFWPKVYFGMLGVACHP